MTDPQSKSPNRRSLRKRQSERERTKQPDGTQERERTSRASPAPRTPENGTTPFIGHRTPEEHHSPARAFTAQKNAGERTNAGSETPHERIPDSRSAPGGMAGGAPPAESDTDTADRPHPLESGAGLRRAAEPRKPCHLYLIMVTLKRNFILQSTLQG